MKKHPFELNDANNYLWHRQGRRHYWGIKGKDYGLLESAANQYPQMDGDLQFLKYKHVSLHQNQYEPREKQQPEERQKAQYKERQFLEEPFDYRKQYTSQKPTVLFKIKTQPVEYNEQPPPRLALDSGEGKRRQLSLMSRNVQVSNRETPTVAVVSEHSKRLSTLDYADQKQRQLEEAIKKTHKRVATEAAVYDKQLDKYRERIIRVVRKDRKNNPTFCNSLAYPLHCHRYVQ